MINKEKAWILLSLRNCKRKRGIGVDELFNDIPDFIEDDFSKFFHTFEDLKKDDLIYNARSSISPGYIITNKGKKEIENFLRGLGPIDYLNFTRSVPEVELDFRIRLIESLLGSLITIFLLFFLMIILEKLNLYHIYIGFIIISTILFLLSFAFFVSFQIAIYFIYLWIKLIYEPFAEKIGEHTKEIAFGLTITVIIGLIIGGFQIFGFKFDEIIPQFFVAFIILIITYWKKISELIYLVINKIFKKTKQKSSE